MTRTQVSNAGPLSPLVCFHEQLNHHAHELSMKKSLITSGLVVKLLDYCNFIGKEGKGCNFKTKATSYQRF